MTKSGRTTKTGRETVIVNGDLFFEDARQCHIDDETMKDIIGDGYTNAIRVMSLNYDWEQTVWLTYETKIVEQINVEMTLRREIRWNRGHWYAYRRVAGKLHKRYVGTDDAINQSRLLEVARKMPSL